MQRRLERIAEKKGRDVGDVVSDLLIKDVQLLEELSNWPWLLRPLSTPIERMCPQPINCVASQSTPGLWERDREGRS